MFKPNVQSKRVWSDVLQTMVPFNLTTTALRMIDRAGGEEPAVRAWHGTTTTRLTVAAPHPQAWTTTCSTRRMRSWTRSQASRSAARPPAWPGAADHRLPAHQRLPID